MHFILCVRCCVVSNLTFPTEGSSVFPCSFEGNLCISWMSCFVGVVLFSCSLGHPDSNSVTHGGVIGLCGISWIPWGADKSVSWAFSYASVMEPWLGIWVPRLKWTSLVVKTPAWCHKLMLWECCSPWLYDIKIDSLHWIKVYL